MVVSFQDKSSSPMATFWPVHHLFWLPLGEKSSAELCARLCTFLLHEQTVAEEMESQLETSRGTVGFLQLFYIIVHLYQLVFSVSSSAACDH